MNHVYQIYLNNRYLYYYYSFTGEHFDTGWSGSMETDEVYTDSTVPIMSGCPYSVRRVVRRSCPTSSENKHWTLLLENRWATGLLQELLCNVNVYSRPTSRDDRRRISLRTTTNKLPETKEKSGLIFLYLISWYLILIKLIWFFKFPL